MSGKEINSKVMLDYRFCWVTLQEFQRFFGSNRGRACGTRSGSRWEISTSANPDMAFRSYF
jgi:hypothetical protein